MQTSKSEERNLKSQQQSRPLANKNARQKTAVAMNNQIVSHTSNNFNKDNGNGLAHNKSSALASLNSQIQS